MKKKYMTPETEVLVLELRGMLMTSPIPGYDGSLGAPSMSDDWEDE